MTTKKSRLPLEIRPTTLALSSTFLAIPFGALGALVNDSDTAASFSGATGASVATVASVAGPQVFGVEAWFRTTSTAGGKIVGFGSSRTGDSVQIDRHVYMLPSGQGRGPLPAARARPCVYPPSPEPLLGCGER